MYAIQKYQHYGIILGRFSTNKQNLSETWTQPPTSKVIPFFWIFLTLQGPLWEYEESLPLCGTAFSAFSLSSDSLLGRLGMASLLLCRENPGRPSLLARLGKLGKASSPSSPEGE